jgi:hypothetical protein
MDNVQHNYRVINQLVSHTFTEPEVVTTTSLKSWFLSYLMMPYQQERLFDITWNEKIITYGELERLGRERSRFT